MPCRMVAVVGLFALDDVLLCLFEQDADYYYALGLGHQENVLIPYYLFNVVRSCIATTVQWWIEESYPGGG